MSAVATKTTCAYCGVGCGILARPLANGGVAIAGDPDHPANFGRLCSKGAALGETLGLEDRLLHPLVHGKRASWDQATALVAEKFSAAIRDHGPDSVAFYVSGQLLTEDYYVANKLMKGFIGSGNIDTNSRLCMASAVAGHRRAFGSDTVPGNYEDLELAGLVVLVGSNLAWCHPVLFQRLMAAKEKHGTRIVTIDPRRTVTADAADLHLPINPGTDVALFLGLMADLHRRGAVDRDYVSRHTSNLDETLATAAAWSMDRVVEVTGLKRSAVAAFFDLFAANARTVTAFSQGVNQSSAGTDKVNAIVNCHLLTGRIGKPGAGPFSITGQPNAMGGREVGGLANMLAAHMEIENAEHRRLAADFWKAPAIATKPGLKAVDLFEAVEAGKIKALWIMATNPAVSMPDGLSIKQALERCPFVAVSDVTAKTETARHAGVLLSAAAWGEKDGTVTNSERRISRQRAFLPLPGEARPDWRIVCDVAQAMGFDGFDFASPAAIFREYAALTSVSNNGSRALDLGAYARLSDDAYDKLEPFQWGGERHFGDGNFYTPDRRARFIATPYRQPLSSPSPAAPLVLNTGRIRDQWHTMTRSGKSARLLAHQAEPFVEIAPRDAAALSLGPAHLAEISTAGARALMRIIVTDRVQPGTVFVPMHWTGEFSCRALVNALSLPNADPVSGQPELKYSPVAVRRHEVSWHGFGVSVAKPAARSCSYWSLAPALGGYRLECAGEAVPDDWLVHAAGMLGIDPSRHDCLTFEDRGSGEFRCAAFVDGTLIAAFFVSRGPVGASRAWLCEQLGKPQGAFRSGILAGRPPAGEIDGGAIICACLAVGRERIAHAVRSGAASVHDIGRKTGAGTNCGSCRPELQRLLAEAAPRLEAAE